jgi:hypothetical protein
MLKTDPGAFIMYRDNFIENTFPRRTMLSAGRPKLRSLLRSAYNAVSEVLPPSGKRIAASIDSALASRPRIYFDRSIHPPNRLWKGAVTISLDFELAWGWQYAKRDHVDWIAMGMHEREQVPIILDELEKYSLPVTWATVGHLFLEQCKRKSHGLAHPEMPRLGHFENLRWNFRSGDWFQHDPCTDVRRGPAWYAPDLIEKILASNVRHEIGAHSFSHVGFGPYCTEEVACAEVEYCNEAMKRFGLTPESWVFPGNEFGHYKTLARNGIRIVRSFPISQGVISLPLLCDHGLWGIHASSAVDRGRIWTNEQRLARLKKFVDAASQTRLAMHLWLHPSLLRSDMENIFFPFLAYCAAQRERGILQVLTLKEVVAQTQSEMHHSNALKEGAHQDFV